MLLGVNNISVLRLLDKGATCGSAGTDGFGLVLEKQARSSMQPLPAEAPGEGPLETVFEALCSLILCRSC